MEYIVPNRKRLPYGMMNFAVIRREDYYYVDKTRFIPMIEQADRFFFFIRPRPLRQKPHAEHTATLLRCAYPR